MYQVSLLKNSKKAKKHLALKKKQETEEDGTVVVRKYAALNVNEALELFFNSCGLEG